jgi:hypothetical protein
VTVNPFELRLPPCTEPLQDVVLVKSCLQAAIGKQQDGRIFPSLEHLAGYFGANSEELGVVRRELVAEGYLTRLGTEYFTAHSERHNRTGRADGHCV